MINSYGFVQVQEVINYARGRKAKNIPAYVLTVLENQNGHKNRQAQENEAITEGNEYKKHLEKYNKFSYSVKNSLLSMKELGDPGSNHNFPDLAWLRKAIDYIDRLGG